MTEPIRFPPKLEPLFKPARYKVLWGGRDAGRSWGAARALLVKGSAKPLRILCGREIQRTLADSVLALLKDQIKLLGLESFYSADESSVSGRNGTEFIFTGLRDLDANKIKSYEGVDVSWIEEAETLTKRSFNILDPTVRKDGSELWFTFNAQMDTDFIYDHFVAHQAPDAVVVYMTWRDNPWASKVLAAGREHMRLTDKDEYENIWEGKVRTVVAGAIYAKEVRTMIEGKRTRPMPYDPQIPVHTVWDLGWNDAMAIILVQRVASAVMVIGYLEASGKTYADCVAELKTLKYVWATDWLPHDGNQTRPDTGKSPKQILEGLGRKDVQIVPLLDPEDGIRAARMMFPRLYIDNTEYENDDWEYDGGARLIECLKRYRRAIPTTTGEPAKPVHDEFCLGPKTMIRTLGGWKPIAELVGKDFHVWGYSESEKRIVPARALKCWQTKTVGVVAKVTLDSGAVITCTPEHRFMLRDGSYVEAQKIAPKASLMPFYERCVNGHMHIHLTDGTLASEHRYAYSKLVGQLVDGQHVHHKDDDKRNNEPTNLQQLTLAEHCSVHSSTSEHKAHLLRIGNKKGSKRATETLIAVNKARAGDNHHTRQPGYWTDERRRLVGEGSSRSLKGSEREKDCPSCGGTFRGNWKRLYCCSKCKDRARVIGARPWRIGSDHGSECALVSPNNHRVVSVEIVIERVAVYDIEVEGIHNFAAEGVIVHNSHGADAVRALATIVDRIRNERWSDNPIPQATYSVLDAEVGI